MSKLLNISIILIHNRSDYGKAVKVDKRAGDKDLNVTSTIFKADDNLLHRPLIMLYRKVEKNNITYSIIKNIDYKDYYYYELQDSPDEIPALYKMITEEDYDLVSGWKQKRFDPLTKTIPTKLYNGVTRVMSGIKLHDMNCGLKAYKKEVVKSVEVYGDMHRYIPVLAKKAGFKKIGEKVVQHQARKYGTTKFGLERFINGPLDLMSVLFMTRFGKRPMHVFGFLGGVMFLLGFINQL